jgi:hypothetical protein
VTSVADTLAIIGAAEGSFYTAGKTVDVRYIPSFANANSGLSFGTFQFDAATNFAAKTAFQDILTIGVDTKAIDTGGSHRLFAAATTRNAKPLFTEKDIAVITALMASTAGKSVIDMQDQMQAVSSASMVDTMIANAAAVWSGKGVKAAPVLTPGQAGCLRLFAYFLASLNRYPGNQQTLQDWLDGANIPLHQGPKGGFQLKAPPTIDEMHTFLKCLKIWDGTQGNYDYLRGRLDPTLDRLGG